MVFQPLHVDPLQINGGRCQTPAFFLLKDSTHRLKLTFYNYHYSLLLASFSIFKEVRTIATICTVIVGFLIFQPAFTEPVEIEKMQCCSEDKCIPGSGEKSQNDCNSDGCNPFMACSMGNFFLVERIIASPFFSYAAKQKIIAVNDNRLSDKISECWHPPETA